MKIPLLILIFSTGYLQYAQHLDEQGKPKLRRIMAEIEKVKLQKSNLLSSNQELAGEVENLINGYDVIEELARQKMGMIHKGETFFRIQGTAEEVNTKDQSR